MEKSTLACVLQDIFHYNPGNIALTVFGHPLDGDQMDSPGLAIINTHWKSLSIGSPFWNSFGSMRTNAKASTAWGRVNCTDGQQHIPVEHPMTMMTMTTTTPGASQTDQMTFLLRHLGRTCANGHTMEGQQQGQCVLLIVSKPVRRDAVLGQNWMDSNLMSTEGYRASRDGQILVSADTTVSSSASPPLLRSWSPGFGLVGRLAPRRAPSWLRLCGSFALVFFLLFGWSPLALLLFIIHFPIEGYGLRSVRRTGPITP